MRHYKSIAIALAVIFISVVSLRAQNNIPRLANGKPDFSGVWEHPYVPDMEKNSANQQGSGPLPFTPEGAAIWNKYDAAKFDYTGRCLPMGLTRLMNSPFPIQIAQTSKDVSFLFEAWSTFHVVPVDGRSHPDDLEPQWNGLSVGHWEGDTLVIETANFNNKSNLDTAGHPHSDQMRVVQRLNRTDDKHIAYEITITDPKMFSKPWKNVRTFTLRPDWELLEYSCEENNKDFVDGHIK